MTAMRAAAILTAWGRRRCWLRFWSVPEAASRRVVANLCGTLICLAPLAAPWVLVGTSGIPLDDLAGRDRGRDRDAQGDRLAGPPRHEDELVRVWLVLTFWPALEIEDVGSANPRSERASSRLRGGSSTGSRESRSAWP